MSECGCGYEYDEHCKGSAVVELEWLLVESDEWKKVKLCSYCLSILKAICDKYGIRYKTKSLMWNVS